ARAIAEKYRAERAAEGGKVFGTLVDRVPLAESINPSRGKKDVKISPKGLHSIMFGTTTIDLGAVEQLVHTSQTRAIADAIYYTRQNYMDGKRTLREVLDGVMADLHEKGLDILHPGPQGDYAMFRKLELAAAINRMRTLKIVHKK
ncbi:MAG: ATPase, partial [Spirochaetota bacterium]